MTTIKLKNGSGAPTSGDLAQGEPALDLTNKRLYTEDSGGTVIEVGTNPGVDVTFADNRKAIFGAGSDLQIYHNGSNSYIDDAGTGSLVIRGNAVNIGKYTGETAAVFTADGSVQLRYDNSAKFETTSSGIDVTGSVVSDGLTVDGDGSFTGNFEISGLSPKIFLNETDTTDVNTRIRNAAGKLQIQTVDNSDANPVTRFQIDHATGDTSFYAGIDVTGTATVDGLDVANVKIESDLTATPTNDGANYIFRAASGHADYNGGDLIIQARSNASRDIYMLTGTTTPVNRFKVDGGGDISFYEDTGTTAKLFWDSSAESLGLGTSSPNDKVDISGSTGDGYRLTDGTHTGVYRSISGGTILKTTSNHALLFGTNDTERMRIDSSGNLLVGTTSISVGQGTTTGVSVRGPIGRIEASASSNTSAIFNRTTSPGAIVNFASDGTTCGQINARSGDLVIGTGTTGLQFYDVGNAIFPLSASGNTNRDAAIDLGEASNRFKDLWLSGGAYLGGVTSANLLDDYEEGTFTVTLRDAASGGNTSSSTVNGTYTKVGRLVTCSFNTALSNIDTTGMTGANTLYMDLPFAKDLQVEDAGTMAYDSLNTSVKIDPSIYNVIPETVSGSGSVLQFRAYGNNTNDVLLQVQDITSGTTDFVRLTITYQAA